MAHLQVIKVRDSEYVSTALTTTVYHMRIPNDLIRKLSGGFQFRIRKTNRHQRQNGEKTSAAFIFYKYK